MSNAKTVMSQAANTWAGPTYIEDVFSTYLYEGNGATGQTITNGIDLAGEGGLVWTKSRNSVTDHALTDTERGKDYTLASNTTAASVANGGGLSSFNSDGYTITVGDSRVNDSGKTYASWTFRKAPRFFDVVTYTGTGSAPNIVPHNLGVTPGFIMVKCTSTATDWACQHIDLSNYLKLNSTQAASGGLLIDPVTDTTFKPKNNPDVNASGQTYVAYLFAHDPLGESGDGSDGLIACGSYTGNGSTQSIDLGFEPQWVLIKETTGAKNWFIFDNMRGMAATGRQYDSPSLSPNLSTAEDANTSLQVQPEATGLYVGNNSQINENTQTYIYIAIRRPQKSSDTASEVFSPVAYTADNTDGRFIDTGIVTDTIFARARNTTSGIGFIVGDRMLGQSFLGTGSTSAMLYDAGGDTLMTPNGGEGNPYASMSGFGVGNDATYKLNYSTYTQIAYAFKRAPGFFDVVAYTGDGVAGRTVSHNLGVAPEMMIVKRRDASRLWGVYHSYLGNAQSITLNSTGGAFASSLWSSTSPTITDFTVDVNFTVNASGGKYIAYLFATLPGVSKVGSYTGNGTSQTINCGFTSGARFILIKRTDSTGDWYVWDTERGIVAANDPHLSLNTTAAEVTTDDSVDPDSSGFIVNQVAATNINVSSATYIFYAIA